MKIIKSIAKNRKAYHDYHVEEKIEAGIELRGSEVKSLRLGHGNISEGYAYVRESQAWMINLTIPLLKQASYNNHEERRQRRLLMHTKEIHKLDEATRQKGYTLVPLEIYFNDKNIVKVMLGLCKGKALYDKRDASKEADAKREADRAKRR